MVERTYYPKVVTTREQLAELVAAYSVWDHFVCDLETVGTRDSRAAAKTKDVTSLDERTNRVLWIGMACPGRVDAIPLGHPEPAPKQLRRSEVLDALRPLFFSERIKVNHNVKFDILSLAKYFGAIPPGPFLDTQSLVHIFNENLREYNLGYLVEHYLGYSYKKLAKEGTPMDQFPFWDVAMYVGFDAKLTHLLYQRIMARIKDKPGLMAVLQLEMQVTEVLIWAKQRGVLLNRQRLTEFDSALGQQIVELSDKIYAVAGRKFLITSGPQKAKVLYEDLKLPCKKMTAGGAKEQPKQATSQDALEAIKSRHPIVPMLLEHAELSKLHSAFTSGLLPHIEDDGRIRASLKQNGTVTGRFSCTAGDTILVTSRGNFRFDEYIPRIGDKVPTHAGEWKPVLRKILKGLDTMYRVCLDSGAELSCTLDHRVLTPEGWKHIRYLAPGDEVCTYDSFPELCQESCSYKESNGVVSIGQQTNCCGGSGSVGNNNSQCSIHSKKQYSSRSFESGTSTQIFTLEDRREKSDEWKEWFPASQLYRRDFRWAQTFTDKDKRQICSGPSSCYGKCLDDKGNSYWISSSSYRRESFEQQSGQSSFSDTCGAPKATCQKTSSVRSIYSLGRMEVWDIEVADSHSYSTQGFFNHNCTQPNLQQIPRQNNAEDDGAKIRSMFEAASGMVLVVGDYSQVEARLMGHFASPLVKTSNLVKAFTTDVDFHAYTAAALFNKPVSEITKDERHVGKTMNFLLIFGGSPNKIVASGGFKLSQAKQYHAAFHGLYPEIQKFANQVEQQLQEMRTPYVQTIYGRRRRLPEVTFPDKWVRARAERQAVNHIIQGSAADVNKIAMVRAFDLIKRYWDLDTWRIILTVHDEILLELPENRAREGIELLSEAMEGVELDLRVPLVAEIHAGPTWSSAK
jgi:DNA polymerase I-like protein with 3'-5' exonuclease and polymerase domains